MSSEIFNTVWSLPQTWRGVVESRFHLSAAAIDNPSPWTGQRTPYGPFVQVWMADLNFPVSPEMPQERGDGTMRPSWRQWQGFVTRLRGTSGKIRLVDPLRTRPSYDLRVEPTLANFSDGSQFSDGTQWITGALPPFVTVDAVAAVDSDTMVLRGLRAGIEQILDAGDVFEVRPNGIPASFACFHEITHCTRTTAAGKARIYFQPGLRQGCSAGDMVVLRNPTCVMRLADKDQGIVSRDLNRHGRLGLSLIEEFRA